MKHVTVRKFHESQLFRLEMSSHEARRSIGNHLQPFDDHPVDKSKWDWQPWYQSGQQPASLIFYLSHHTCVCIPTVHNLCVNQPQDPFESFGTENYRPNRYQSISIRSEWATFKPFTSSCGCHLSRPRLTSSSSSSMRRAERICPVRRMIWRLNFSTICPVTFSARYGRHGRTVWMSRVDDDGNINSRPLNGWEIFLRFVLVRVRRFRKCEKSILYRWHIYRPRGGANGSRWWGQKD